METCFRYEVYKQIIDLSDVTGEQNAYKVLGVGHTASQSEITARWRALSREFHPDKIKDPAKQREAQERFMEIQQSYEILSNSKTKRKRKNKQSVRDWMPKQRGIIIREDYFMWIVKSTRRERKYCVVFFSTIIFIILFKYDCPITTVIITTIKSCGFCLRGILFIFVNVPNEVINFYFIYV